MKPAFSFEITQKQSLGNPKDWPVLAGPFMIPREAEGVEAVLRPLRSGGIDYRVVSLSKFDNVVEVRRTRVGYIDKLSERLKRFQTA